MNYKKQLQRFLLRFPHYADTSRLDELRKTDYSRLDVQKHVYLDYTGGNLYPDSLVAQHQELLTRGVFGNPHSMNPTSMAMTVLVEQAREHVLKFFNASPEDYTVIFTPNASGALKLVGESYPFAKDDQYLMTFDNHNSVLGIREFNRAKGGQTTYIPLKVPEMLIEESELVRSLELAKPGHNNLFAFPAQSNFTGAKHPLEWVNLAKQKGWDVLLDAAAFVPTSKLDLSVYKADYVAVSFYKIFGYPTGVGALIARREALRKLRRPWFGGGTIVAVSVKAGQHFLAKEPAGFEDGTPNYLSLPAIDFGLSFIENLGFNLIQTRVSTLTTWLIEELSALTHKNGKPLVQIYGPQEPLRRGGTLAMNFFKPSGRAYDYRHIEQEANKLNISIRTGCFCNPGTGETAFGLSQSEIITCFAQAESYTTTDDFRHCFEEDEVVGAIRISLGFISNFHDVLRFRDFAKTFCE